VDRRINERAVAEAVVRGLLERLQQLDRQQRAVREAVGPGKTEDG
jgi:hypothetical protein